MSYGGAGYTSSGADEQQRYGNGTSYPTGVNGPMVYRPLLEDGINASHGYGKPLLPPAELNGVSGYGKPLQPPPGFSEQARYGNPVLMPPRINAPHGYDRTVPIPPKGNVPPVFNGQAPPPFGNNCAATVNNGSATVNNVPATVNNRSYDGIEAGVPSINNNEIASCTYGTSQVGHNGTLFQQTNGGGFVNHGRAGFDNLNTGNDKQFNLNSTETDNCFNGEDSRQNFNAEDSQKDKKADDRFNLLFGDESRFQALCNKDHYQVYQSQMEVIKSFYKKALSNLKDNQLTSLPDIDETFFNLKMISREGKLDSYIVKGMKKHVETDDNVDGIFGFCKLLQAYTDQRWLEDETEDSDEIVSNLIHQDEPTSLMYGLDDERYNSTFKNAVKWEAVCKPEHLEVYKSQVEILRRFYKVCRIALMKKDLGMELHEFDETIMDCIEDATFGNLDNYMVNALKRVLNDKCRNNDKLLEAYYALVAYRLLKYQGEDSRPNVRVPRDHEKAHQDTAQCHQEAAQCRQETAPSFETNQYTEGLASALDCPQHTSEFERLQQFYEAVMTNPNTGNDKQFNLNSTETNNRVSGEDSQKDNKADDRFNLLFGDESRFQALCNKDHYQVYQSQMEVIKSFYKKSSVQFKRQSIYKSRV
ncbi:unnamed protein product [Bursaphelenchus okinawaensis]|uniref:Uncharacterized protein n=1 Tax=Bursaphelenchus okinawaensis TaxID=465554 RepID=A0A811KD01_9BILA|nr:unnamed protein product [Bursaphelenchus okinawaensis]CAG9099148.1 unnamed protein product [Bursaphelenchus okinawaensis]